MFEHLDEPITVRQLARLAAMSPRNFARRFGDATGTTPIRWLTHQRILRAQDLLVATTLPVEVIASRVGFGTAVNLRQHFRRGDVDDARRVSPAGPAADLTPCLRPARLYEAGCSGRGPPQSVGGLANTLAVIPARMVSIAAATGATNAPIGMRVGSEPVSATGSVMLRIAATSQIATVVTDNPIQTGIREALPRSLPIIHKTAPMATRPHSQVPNAATGMCSCSLPEIMSGARMLITTTATQIPAMPAAVHAIQEPSAIAER
jgi:hypothetical protein